MTEFQGKNKLWGGRFQEATHELMERLNASIGFDQRLTLQDIRASQAHARMLGRQGIIGPEEAESLVAGLEKVLGEIQAGTLEFKDSLEDIHTHVEMRLKEIIGPVAGKLHTARSRNDQVATDLRLWLMDGGKDLDRALLEYQRALCTLADEHKDVILPGYTHLQRAQPILLAHHFLAYLEMAQRDRERLADCLKRTAVLPLGAAALAGTTFPVDPESVARELEFNSICKNSLDAVSDRDFAVEFLFVLGLLQVHLSRLAEELVLWSSQEFGFITLSDQFATGSSIMPQKKNPDAAELIRGKAGRVLGHLVALMTTLKGLPLAYNKDLQEDKEPLFDAFDTVMDCLRVLAPLLTSLRVHQERMASAVEEGFLNATELADYLAARGLSFREAHHVAGQAVIMAEDKNCRLGDLSLDDYQKLLLSESNGREQGKGKDAPVIGEDIFQVLAPSAAIERRLSPGGTAYINVQEALKEARKRLWPEK